MSRWRRREILADLPTAEEEAGGNRRGRYREVEARWLCGTRRKRPASRRPAAAAVPALTASNSCDAVAWRHRRRRGSVRCRSRHPQRPVYNTHAPRHEYTQPSKGDRYSFDSTAVRRSFDSGCPIFFNIDFPYTFPWLFHDQKKKIHDLSAQHIFPSKRYTTYECISELVVTVPYARSTIVKKIKRFIIWLYKWSRVTFTELLSAVVKISWHYHHFPWLFHDFPRPLLFCMTFQAWKMVFPNSMTFHNQGAPCRLLIEGNPGHSDATGADDPSAAISLTYLLLYASVQQQLGLRS